MEDNKTTEVVRKEADRLKERARTLAEDAIENGRETFKEVQSKSKEAFDDIQQRSSEAWQDAEKLVRKYPGKAIGLSLLVGTLIGAIMSFRKQRD